MRTIASASDVRLLQAYADPDRLEILLQLFRAPATQKELGGALGLNSGSISRHMKVLEDADLVEHPRSHAPYALVAREESWQILRATTNLTEALAKRHLEATQQRSSEIQRAAMRSTPSVVETDSG